MQSVFISAIFRRWAGSVLAAVFLLVPGATAADESAAPLPLPVVVASGDLMNSAVYDALLSAGASEEQARAAARSVANTDGLVTKADLSEAKSNLVTKADLSEAKSNLVTKADLSEAKSNLATKADLAEVKSELKGEIAQLRNDMILLGAATAGALILMMVGGFHLLWRRLSELAERLPPAHTAAS